MQQNDTICAHATPVGSSALAVIRLSGSRSIKIMSALFKPLSQTLSASDFTPRKLYNGSIIYNDRPIDDVLLVFFRNPHSYTGEDAAEIYCHGSDYIVESIIKALIANGCRIARPGEFSFRAFQNGKLDLIKAEAVADLIQAQSQAAHRVAYQQMRGGFSSEIAQLRQQLLDFTSLIELELDFSEEDVEFADRTQLMALINNIIHHIEKLTCSFGLGNVMKKGIPVTIAGSPNVGKSTLLNALLNEEKALVSDVPGTTRDAIEDVLIIDGVAFRFIDTAGLRETLDPLEDAGIERTYQKMNEAMIILYLIDISTIRIEVLKSDIRKLQEKLTDKNKRIIVVANKIDMLVEIPKGFLEFLNLETIFISAKRRENLEVINDSLMKAADIINSEENTVVSNTRHYEALLNAGKALSQVREAMLKKVSGDLISSDLREALYHLGLISGNIVNQEVLNNIFGRFCVGK
jgi:tRNA modification GTPase